MIINNLYNDILISPTETGANQLFVVSGYASATFVRKHLTQLQDKDFKLKLIIGMPSKKNDHRAFLQLHKDFSNKFKGYYYNSLPPVHCKLYSWFNKNKPSIGFTGSANYSQYGFFTSQQVNQLNQDDPIEIKEFFDNLLKKSTFIPDARIEDTLPERLPSISGSIIPGGIEWIEQDKSVRISFLQRNGTLPTRSGLNWGQRKGREPNQAYLSIKKDARKKGFLPEKGFTFTLLTDDNKIFDCVVAQDGRKAIHTTKDNSELGKYIRNRIGVPLGIFLTVEHLEQYGRTDFTLLKLDDETFEFDFSVQK